MHRFAEDVREGLSSDPKYLSSKYFYDSAGDKLFQQIMHLEEYYLTRCEFEILEKYKAELLGRFGNGKPFQLLEFGAGDGLKTKILLDYFLNQGADFQYLPIDISQNALDSLMEDLAQKFPDLKGYSINDDYFSALTELSKFDLPKVILFLGSNIGNFRPEAAVRFMARMRGEVDVGDLVLLGVDLQKDPEIIRKAYNDPMGVTRDFNLNLLSRINRELDGNFKIEDFEHAPVYNPETGAAESFITSRRNQVVRIAKVGLDVHFKKSERIFTEISQKYDLQEVRGMATKAGFEVLAEYTDSRNYFVDSLWQAI